MHPLPPATPSKRAHCWLKFFLQDENLALHLHALERVRAALLVHQLGLPAALHMVNMDSLCRTRRYANVLLLKASEGFLNAENGIWEALIRNLLFAGDCWTS